MPIGDFNDFREQDEFIADIYTILHRSWIEYDKNPSQVPNPMTAAVLKVYHKYKIIKNE